jgi:hypothetical protein
VAQSKIPIRLAKLTQAALAPELAASGFSPMDLQNSSDCGRKAIALKLVPMLTLAICLVAVVAVCRYLFSLLTAVDYNSYIREMKLRLPATTGTFRSFGR